MIPAIVADDMLASVADGEFMAFARMDIEALETAMRIATTALKSHGDIKALREIGSALKPITRNRF